MPTLSAEILGSALLSGRPATALEVDGELPQDERDQDLYSLSSLRPALVIARRAGRSVTRRTEPVLTRACSPSVRARKVRRDRVAASSSLNGTPASPCWAAKPSRASRTDTL